MSTAKSCLSVSANPRASCGQAWVHHTQTRRIDMLRAMRRPAETRCRAWLLYMALEDGGPIVEYNAIER